MSQHEAYTNSNGKVELFKGDVRGEKRESQLIHIVSGTAWVSMDCEDFVLEAGEDFRLSRGKYNAIISTANSLPVVYEIKS